MASTAFTNVFLSSPRPDAGIPDFDSLQIVPSDFWRRHFLVHDCNFRKLGSCDFSVVSGTSRLLTAIPHSWALPVMMLSALG